MTLVAACGRILGLLVFLASGPAAAAQPERAGPEVVLSLDRMRTCDRCPSYEWQFFSDGTHLYRGRDGVYVLGERGSALYRERDIEKFGIEEFRAIHSWGRQQTAVAVRKLADRGFFALSDDYAEPGASGRATFRITVRRGRESKSVRFQDGAAPADAGEYARIVDDLLGKLEYVRPVDAFASDGDAALHLAWQDAGPCGGERLALLYRSGRFVHYARPNHLSLPPAAFPRFESRPGAGRIAEILALVDRSGLAALPSQPESVAGNLRTAVSWKGPDGVRTVFDAPLAGDLGRAVALIREEADRAAGDASRVPERLRAVCGS